MVQATVSVALGPGKFISFLEGSNSTEFAFIAMVMSGIITLPLTIPMGMVCLTLCPKEKSNEKY